MKIGQFSDSFLPIYDGVGRVVYNYCETIGKKGHECYAIVPFADMGYRGNYPFEIVDFHSRALPTMPQYRTGLPIFDTHYNARLEMIDMDIVHLHSPFIAGMEAVRYAKKKNIPLVGTFHSKFHDDFMQITGQEFLADMGVKRVVSLFNNCTEVWAVSETSAQTLKEYGFEKEIYVIPNGMNTRLISDEKIVKTRKQFNIDDRPVLLFVGQLNWKKNILRILEACALLKKASVSVQLILAGQGPHEKEIKEKINDLNIYDMTKMIGHIQDSDLLDGLYALSSLFVFPSLYDNAPMVVREAANAKTPSVVVSFSNSAEVVINNVNGLHCQDDSNDLFMVIKDILNDPVKLKELGLQAQKTIPIAWDKVIDQALARYQYLIERYK